MDFAQGALRDCPVRRQPKYRVQVLDIEVDAMPSTTEITVSQLSRLVGIPGAPALVDVRTDEEFKADPRLIPTARRRDSRDIASWGKAYRDRPVIVCCLRGLKLSQ